MGKEFSINSRYLYITNIYNYNQDLLHIFINSYKNLSIPFPLFKANKNGHGSGVILNGSHGKIYIDTRGSTDSLCSK